MALVREMNGETPARPLTHELIQNVCLGFDLEVKQIVISSIIENTFCATLTLAQKVETTSGEWAGRRNEVRIDARPSDCLVLARKNNVDIQVAREVFDQVQDVSKMTDEVEGNLAGLASGEFDIEFRGEGSEGHEGLEDEDTEDFFSDDSEDEEMEGFGGFKP